MRLENDQRLIAKLMKLPVKEQARIARAIRTNTEKTAKIARALAPVREGYTKGDIHTKYEPSGMRASVEAARPTKDEQIRAGAIEFGRKKGIRGTTHPQPYIRPAQGYMGRRFARSIRRALKKAVSESMRG